MVAVSCNWQLFDSWVGISQSNNYFLDNIRVVFLCFRLSILARFCLSSEVFSRTETLYSPIVDFTSTPLWSEYHKLEYTCSQVIQRWEYLVLLRSIRIVWSHYLKGIFNIIVRLTSQVEYSKSLTDFFPSVSNQLLFFISADFFGSCLTHRTQTRAQSSLHSGSS